MNAYESQSESESDSHSVLVTISSELIINENEKEKNEVSAEQTSDKTQDSLYIFEKILSPHKNNKDHLIGEKEEAQLKEGEDRIVGLESFQSLLSKKANPACETQLQNSLEHHENNTLDKAIERNPIVITEQASENKEENRPRDREERPLVLEERHSLSIAETKKRRASVYCDDNLFIPRELARSELHQRRFPTTVNNLDRISKHSDYRLRMLKFPVGSGRARFVAQQLKRRKLREQRMKTEEKRKLLEDKKSQMKAETQLMPNLNQEKLPSDEECCIILEEIVVSETEEDGTDELIERVSKRQLKRSSSLDLSRSSAEELLADKQDQQQLPLFRWHNPDCSDNSRKMGILEDISLSASVDIQVGYSEMPNTSSETASQQQPQQHQQVIVEVVSAELQPQQQPSPRPCAEVVEQSQQVVEVQHLEVQRQQEQQRLQQQPQQQQHPQQQYQPHIAAAANRLPAATTANSRDMEPLRQQLMHRIILPQLQTEDLPESSIVNNNAVSLMNQNLQPHFIDSSMGDSEWTQLQYDKYALVLSSQHQQQQQQQQHQQQQQQNQQHQQQQQRQQQLVPLWQQQQPSYQMSHQEHQHLEAEREELQQLNAQYQRLKCQEEEKLKCLNNTLKEVYADRLLSERQHADLHRLFMHKMVESKKHEDSLHSQRDQLKRQLKEDLDSLEQRIAEKQRQLQERSRSWQWQQQQQQQQYHHHHQHPHQQQHQQQRQLQYQQQQQLQLTYSQQQHQHQQQQQHQYYLRQLQPPPYQPRLQCFQDAFSQYAESQLVDSNNSLMPPPPPPPVTTTTLASLRPTPMQPPPPPPVAYRTDIRQQPARSGRMMRRRHTIDHRANNMMLYPPYATPPAAPPRDALRRTNVTAATAAHFSRPDTSTTVANERNHVNQAIEQTAITSIISNYVTNYLNDMESRNP